MPDPLPFADLVPRAGMPGLGWPSLPPAGGLATLGLLYQLERTQWWPAERIVQWQERQLAELLDHARKHTAYGRDVLGDGGWERVPVLTRAVVRDRGADLRAHSTPAQHGATDVVATTGSTGARVEVARTALVSQLWQVLTLREHAWHRRDLRGKLAALRHPFAEGAGAPPGGSSAPGWGVSTDTVFPTGPSTLLSIHTQPDVQAAWLARERPDYLLTYPSALRPLALHYHSSGTRPPPLREVRTLGETLPEETRALCREVFGVKVVDVYSSQEVGYIALQCPDHEHYHVQSEVLRVEVLRDDGRPCGPGEVGRVVVTALHNLATVLLRYEIGDYAEVGEPCPCGRGLPVLRRVVGRVRNLLVLPDGRRVWPHLHTTAYGELAPIRQFQFVQTSLEVVEARLVVDRPLTPEEERAVARALLEALGHPFEVVFRYPDALPRGPGGKYEDFRSEVAP